METNNDKKKLCLILNVAPHYRISIFSLMDREFDCDYVFGEMLGDIKQMDTSKLRGKVTKVRNRFFKNGFYWQSGVQKFLKNKYAAYILLGDTRCLSTWLFCLRAKFTGRSKRIYFWTHGWYGKETHIERWLKKFFFQLAGGGIFLYGNYARDLMIKEGFDAKKLYVIHNSLNYEYQMTLRNSSKLSDVYHKYFGNSYPVLLMIGRLNFRKRIEMLIEAVSFLKRNGMLLNIVLIGDGEGRKALESVVIELGIESHVWFYGACYDEQINAELIFNADVCVVPGDIGLTAIHSMMFGTPCITHSDFKHQGPEFEAIKDGYTGAFFESGNIEALAETIKHWFETNQSIREDVRKACFHEIDTNWTPQFQIDIFRSVLNGNGIH